MTEIVWNKFDGEYLPTDEDIQMVEKKIGFEFPKDFIEVMKMNDGACPSVRTFDILGDESCINNLLSFDESAAQSIVFAYNVVQGRGVKMYIQSQGIHLEIICVIRSVSLTN